MNKKMLAIGMFFTVSLCMHAMDNQQRSNAQICEAYLAAQQRRAVQAGVGSAADAVDELARVEVEPHVESLELRSESPGCVSGHDDVLGEHQDIKRQLIKAAQHNDLDRFLKLQEHSEQLPEGWTPLRAACYGGSLRIVQYLVEHHNAKFDVADLSPLRCAAAHNHVDIIRYAHHAQIIPHRIAHDCMRVACEKGHLETVQCLRQECGVGTWTVIQQSSHGCRKNSLDVACEAGHLPIVRDLLEREISVDLQFRLRACRPEDQRLSRAEIEEKVVKSILVDRCARRVVQTNKCTKCGNWVASELSACMLNHSKHIERRVERLLPSPLHYACLGGHLEIARYLIERGMPVEVMFNSEDCDFTWGVAQCAYVSGNVELATYIHEVLQALAQQKKEPSGFFRKMLKKIKRRENPSAEEPYYDLHIVAERGQFSMLEYLLARAPQNALTQWRDHKDRTVLMCAVDGRNRAMVNGLILKQLILRVPAEERNQRIYKESAQMLDEQLNEAEADLRRRLERVAHLVEKLRRRLENLMRRWNLAPEMQQDIQAHLDNGAPLPDGVDERVRAQIRYIDKEAQQRDGRLNRLTQMQQFIAMRRSSMLASILNVLHNKFVRDLGGSVSLMGIQEDIRAGRWHDEAPSPLLALPPEILCRIASLAYGYDGPLWYKPSISRSGSRKDIN